MLFEHHFRAGLELLLGLLGSSSPKQQLDGSVALYKLANKAMTLSPVDAAPPSPTPQVSILSKSGVIFFFLPCHDLDFFQVFYAHNHGRYKCERMLQFTKTNHARI